MFEAIQALETHVTKIHVEVEYDCKSCGQQFEDRHNLKEHMKRGHSRRENFVWTECEDMFETTNALKKHGKRIHVEEVE
jgi:hypothetical protein